MAEPELSLELCGVYLPNPTVLAAGILGLTAGSLVRVARAGAGAVTTKSFSLKPRRGHPNPTVLDWGVGLINAIGLSNPGLIAMGKEIAQARAELAKLGVPLIASVFAESVESFAETARRATQFRPDFIELNISCPNVEDKFGQMFAADPLTAAGVTRAVKSATDIPLIVKLSPNVTHLGPIAEAVVEAGADAICAVNSLGPGMVIDIESGMPVLANRVGGVSGPAIKPIAVRCVYEICSRVDVPVIGLGGVLTGADAVEMMMAGAQAVGLGSAVYYRGVEVFGQVIRELSEFLEKRGYRSLDEVRGRALAGRNP